MATARDLEWRPERLRCERLASPVVVGTARPVFTWRLPAAAGDEAQAAYQVVVAGASEPAVSESCSWDSGWVESAQARARYGGPELASRSQLSWSVRARTASGRVSAWSEPARFEVGLLHPSDWRAFWVAKPPSADRRQWRAPYLLRRRFELASAPARAKAYVSALGAYELYLNGARAGDALMRPGWTDYRRRAQYQVLDVTTLLEAGTNVIGAIVAPGWYAGRVSSQVTGPTDEPAPVPELLCQLEVGLQGGEALTIGTDERWEWGPSAVLSSDLYDGEDWDRRLLSTGWATARPGGAERPSAAGATGEWQPVERTRGTAGALVAQRAEPVRVTGVVAGQVTWREDGTALVDAGRNRTGFLRLLADEERGRVIEVRYGEILSPAGDLYRENLRSARCTDSFVCAGGGAEELAPAFSYRGWRYAEVSGISSPARLLSAESVVVGTDMARTGWFSCSEPLLEEIYELMVTSLQANFVEVPTDCPQRDERMGWMADALLFAPVAAYTYDIGPLMAKWFTDILDARTPAGGFADIAPRPSSTWPGRSFEAGAPAWADAGVLLPWLMYERYGDRGSLEAMFPAMLEWLGLVHRENPDGLWRHGRGNDYGDWVPAGPDTSHDLFSTCWLYRSTTVAASVAEIVGDAGAATWLRERAASVRDAFSAHYVDLATGRVRDPSVLPTGPRRAAEGDGRPPPARETQTGYVLPLVFGLLDGGLAGAAGQHLAGMVRRAGRKLETGFCGSAYLLPALELAGQVGLAYDLLLRRELPSLGFMVGMGATSVWERWDGLDAEGRPATPEMNSFNHYAMSSMLSWLVEGVCGLRPVPGVPSLGEVRFAPAVSRRLSNAEFAFEAPAGRLELAWSWDGDHHVVGQVRVPPGMKCSIAREVAIDDEGRAVASGVAGSYGDRVVGAGNHEVTWRAQ